MNPLGPPAGPPTASSSQFSPTSSPLHPPSVAHNVRILSSLATLSACFSGLTAGILGLTNLSGFLLYLTTSFLSAITIYALKCKFDLARYVPQAHTVITGPGNPGAGGGSGGDVKRWKGWLGLMGLGQENLLGFLLFWIGGYALIHGEFGDHLLLSSSSVFP
ncbi:hypothetical protein BCR39DRAFT_514909 [Naematelia encephala]|uniref:ER membrane protein complex subunit 6 n=1 Tax=Naematelia encephala TaxID=71784 RepID=A0A1Y2BL44_9TREE|nr:hypothetical protein BCR39DRAFT_514909 [Naematelia encephala]